MIAAIPYYELTMVQDGLRVIFGSVQFTIPTFGIPLDPWALLVCLGILLGMEMSRARALRMGIEPRDIVDGIVFMVLTGFLGAHVFTVLAYYPERLVEDGIWALLRVWEGFSSTGGFIGSFLGIFVFYRWMRPRDLGRFADLIAYGFPLGWTLGRAGCAVVHDHVGKQTSAPFGVWFPEGHWAALGGEGVVRHELGLYEMVLTIPIVLLFVWLGRQDRPAGTFFGLFFVYYAPMRLGLDFLRNDDLSFQDARYFGLTPAQYGMVALFVFGVWLLWRRDVAGFRPWPLDGAADQASRALPSRAEAAGGA